MCEGFVRFLQRIQKETLNPKPKTLIPDPKRGFGFGGLGSAVRGLESAVRRSWDEGVV